MSQWAIYYRGGHRVTSQDHEVRQVPGMIDGHGVLCIAQWDGGVEKREMTHGTGVYVVNWYWWDFGGNWWIGGDDVGLAMYLASPGWKKVLPGETAPNDEWRATVARAVEDHLEGDESFMVT